MTHDLDTIIAALEMALKNTMPYIRKAEGFFTRILENPAYVELSNALTLAKQLRDGGGEQIPSRYYEELHPIGDWQEDDGNVLWWRLPVCEPPYCGTPNDTDFYADNGEGYFTHFSYIVRNSVIGEWNKRLDKPAKQEG